MGNSRSKPKTIPQPPSRRQLDASKRAANKDRTKSRRRKKILAKRGMKRNQYQDDNHDGDTNEKQNKKSGNISNMGSTSESDSDPTKGLYLNLTPSRDGIATVATTPASFDRSVSSLDVRICPTPSPPSSPLTPLNEKSDYLLLLPEPKALFSGQNKNIQPRNEASSIDGSTNSNKLFPAREIGGDFIGDSDADQLSLSDLDDNEHDDRINCDDENSEISESMFSDDSSEYNYNEQREHGAQAHSIASSISMRRRNLRLSTLSVKSSRSSVRSVCSFIGGRSTCTTRTRKKLPKPTATNAFETLPHHLIKNSLIRQAASTLRDERFIARRIKKLGAVYASQVHTLDFNTFHDKMLEDAEEIEKERTMLDAPIPSTSTLADGEDIDQVTIESFDLFEKCIMDLCGIQIVKNKAEGDEDDGISDVQGLEVRNCLSAEVDEESNKTDQELEVRNCFSEEAACERTVASIREPEIRLDDGGRALYTLGKFCQKSEWNDDAMHYYRHAMYLLFLDVGLEEIRLLDNGDDCDGFFYVQASRNAEMNSSVTNQYLSTIFFKLGDIHGQKGERNDALHAYRASQEFGKKYLRYIGETSDNEDDVVAAVEHLALSYNRIGAVYTSKGDLESALGSLHEALEIQVETLGEEHIEVAKTLHNIGVCHRHRGKWDGALEFYQHAYHIFCLNLGRDHLDTVRTLHNIGGVYRRRKEYTEAMECFKEVLEVRRRILGEDHPSVAITLVSMAAVLRRAGRKREANKFYALALK